MFRSRNILFQDLSRFYRNDLQKKIVALQFIYSYNLPRATHLTRFKFILTILYVNFSIHIILFI